VRRGQPEDQANQASRLNLVTNAVIVWNTVSMGAVIQRLKAKGERIDPEDLAHLSPARYEHINPYGRYQFLVDRWAGKKPQILGRARRQLRLRLAVTPPARHTPTARLCSCREP
jgi:hypothetical protein